MASKTTEEMNEHRNPRTTLGTANVSETGLNDRLLSAAVTRESAPAGRRPGDRPPPHAAVWETEPAVWPPVNEADPRDSGAATTTEVHGV